MIVKRSKFFVDASIIFVLVAMTVAVFFVLASLEEPITHKNIEVARVKVLVTGDADPGAGNSGFYYFMIYPHSADPGTDYATNLSNATAYEFSDIGNTSCTGETPYNTAFDIVLKVGVNDTDGLNMSSSAWDDDYIWLTLTCSDLSIGADTNMTEIEIDNTASYRWMHYYLNNGGVGYQIVLGEHFNVSSCKFYVMRPSS